MRIFLLALYRDHLMAVHMERKKKETSRYRDGWGRDKGD